MMKRTLFRLALLWLGFGIIALYGKFAATDTLRSSFSLWFWMMPAKCQPKGCTTNVVRVRSSSFSLQFAATL